MVNKSEESFCMHSNFDGKGKFSPAYLDVLVSNLSQDLTLGIELFASLQ